MFSNLNWILFVSQRLSQPGLLLGTPLGSLEVEERDPRPAHTPGGGGPWAVYNKHYCPERAWLTRSQDSVGPLNC